MGGGDGEAERDCGDERGGEDGGEGGGDGEGTRLSGFWLCFSHPMRLLVLTVTLLLLIKV